MVLIETGKSKPDQVNHDGNTALMYACQNGSTDIAIALIETGKSKLEQVNNDGNTALIYACQNEMTDVAMALIATGKSRPEQVNNDGDTALIIACQYGLIDIVMALIATGKSRPEQVNNTDNTALIALCQFAQHANAYQLHNIIDAMMALIKTGKSIVDQSVVNYLCNNNRVDTSKIIIYLYNNGYANLFTDAATSEPTQCIQKLMYNAVVHNKKVDKFVDEIAFPPPSNNKTARNRVASSDLIMDNIKSYLKKPGEQLNIMDTPLGGGGRHRRHRCHRRRTYRTYRKRRGTTHKYRNCKSFRRLRRP